MNYGFISGRSSLRGWADTREDSPEPEAYVLGDLLLDIENTDEQIRCKAMDRITKFIEFAHGERSTPALINSLQHFLCPALFQMAAHCPTTGEDSHFCSEMNAVAALCLVAANVEKHEKEWVFDSFLPAFSALMIHGSSMVRKLSLTHLADLGDLFGDEFTRSAILPHFLAGCADDNHRVRKVCAEQFGRLAARCTSEDRKGELTAAFLRLLNDSNKMVHMTAAHQLGPFIATFADSERTGLELKDGRLMRVEKKAEPMEWKETRACSKGAEEEAEIPPDPENRSSLTMECEGDAEDPKEMFNSSVCSSASTISSTEDFLREVRESRPDERRFTEPPPGFKMPSDAKGRPNSLPVFSWDSSEDEERFGTPQRTPRRPINTKRMFAEEEDMSALDELEDEEEEFGSGLNQTFVAEDAYEEIDSPYDPNAGHMPPLDLAPIQEGFSFEKPTDEEPTTWEEIQEEFLIMWVDEEPTASIEEKKSEEEAGGAGDAECLAVVPAESPLISIGLPPFHSSPLRSPPTRVELTPSTPPNRWTSPCSSSLLPQGVSPLQRKVSPTTLAIRAAFSDDNVLLEQAEVVGIRPRTEASVSPKNPHPAALTLSTPPSNRRLPSGASPLSRRLSPTSVAIAAAEGEEAMDAMVDAHLSPLPAGESSPTSWSAVFKSVNRIIPSNVKSAAAGVVQQFSSFKAAASPSTSTSSSASPSSLFSTLKLQSPAGRSSDALRSPLRPRRLFGSPKRPASHSPVESPKQPKRLRSSVGRPATPVCCRSDEEAVRAAIYEKEFPPQSTIGDEGVRRFLSPDEQAAYFSGVQDAIPQPLLDSLQTFQTHGLKEPTEEHNGILAHAFPAIAFTFGAERWLFIKAIFLSLSVSPQTSVRATIARSLHEMAAIVGVERATRDLVPVFHRLADDISDVQAGLLRNLAAFFRSVDEERRPEMAARLACFNTIEGQWRLRHEFIEQLTLMVDLFKPYPANQFLVPFALSFATDRTAEVRKSAVNLLASLLSMFVHHEHEAARAAGRPPNAPDSRPLTEGLLKDCEKGFAESQSWRNRQSYAMMMEAILRRELMEPAVFFGLFEKRLIGVFDDKVRNVRQFFCSTARLLRAARTDGQPEDAEWATFGREQLHKLAADDSDLEIKMQARVALGTMDPRVDELDLSARAQLSEEREEERMK